MSSEDLPHARVRPEGWTPYGYVPSEAAGVVMAIIFGLSTLLHAGKAVYFRKSWMIPTIILCGGMETLGWIGRLWSHYEPLNMSAFRLQIISLILAPTPLLAAVFVLFGQVIAALGPAYSILTPRYYTVIFLSCDIIALVVQALGGGVAASASNSGKNAGAGSNIMLGGIIFQLIVIVVFAGCAVHYVIGYIKNKPVRRQVKFSEKISAAGLGRGDLTSTNKIALGGLAFITTVLFIRAIYRMIELADGWDGRIMTTERFFIVLDGVMIAFAMLAFNAVLPVWFSADQKTATTVSETSEIELNGRNPFQDGYGHIQSTRSLIQE